MFDGHGMQQKPFALIMQHLPTANTAKLGKVWLSSGSSRHEQLAKGHLSLLAIMLQMIHLLIVSENDRLLGVSIAIMDMLWKMLLNHP